eukprot:CAMPEP_0204618226 /NCGR_PEP_ID=MMETSP0717-20131115/4950_1 /ASSEMBLY_ACC=CAM_ASM_000666 /TAXON_ID=230516 /ORGANISM="Chaetoceros curvisetus" /LENGTH=138 /DNA_ID=CAMNT_0051631921 /DNA_START=1 /DNA_END=417 /DNA_ORIENTATION=+
MTGASKIPPHIARELRRHVLKTPHQSSSKSSSTEGNGAIRTFLGCTAFIGVMASIPFVAMQWIGPLNERDEKLTAAQIRRGAFNNSGSRDAGKDPYWDFKTGTRKKDKDYENMFLKDNPNEIDHGDKFVHDSKRSGGR